MECLSKVGTLGIIGVYPESLYSFPIGMAMEKNITIRMGNCNHRKYIPLLIDFVRTGVVNPAKLLSHELPLSSVIDAYQNFGRRRHGWLKVALLPGEAFRKKSSTDEAA